MKLVTFSSLKTSYGLPLVSVALKRGAVGNSNVDYNSGKEVQIEVFPNPANTYVDFEVNIPEEVRYCDAAIFDLSGRQLRRASYGQLKQGKYTNRFDLDGIKPGILILKVWTDFGENVLKVVKW